MSEFVARIAGGVADLPGIALGLVASGLWALGTVLVRRMPGVPPLKIVMPTPAPARRPATGSGARSYTASFSLTVSAIWQPSP